MITAGINIMQLYTPVRTETSIMNNLASLNYASLLLP